MRRRTFLGLLAGAAASVAVGWQVTRNSGPSHESFAREAIRRMLGDPAPAARIGAVYLAQIPGAAAGREGYVFRPLDPAHFPGGETAMDRLESLDLALPVRFAARRDSVENRFVQIDGWLLPSTICDLCAVANRQLT